MKQAFRVTLVLLLSLLAQSLLGRGFGNVPLWVDLPLVAVVYAALSGGRVVGLLGGTVVGLIQDAMGGGVLGIGGMAKSLAGFLAGVTGTQFIVTQTMPRLLVFMGATLVNALIFMGLYAMLGLRQFHQPLLDVVSQTVANALAGATVFAVADFLPGARERWRVRREYRKRARFR